MNFSINWGVSQQSTSKNQVFNLSQLQQANQLESELGTAQPKLGGYYVG